MYDPVGIVRQFGQVRALVVGDALLDTYFQGTAIRLSPEGPVPVVKAREKVHLPGGAANTAVNARKLGADVSFLTVVGCDSAAATLKRVLADNGVQLDNVLEDHARATVSKLRIVAGGQLIVRFDEGDTADLRGTTEKRFLARFCELYSASDVVIISDYLTGIITPRFIRQLARLNDNGRKLIVADSKNLRCHRFANVTVVTPNHLEAQYASRLDLRPDEDISLDGNVERVGWDLLHRIKTRWLVITIGAGGAVLFERDNSVYRVQADAVVAGQAVGAGDTFTSAIGLALAAGADIRTAVYIANQAAGIAAAKQRTVYVTQQELLQRLGDIGHSVRLGADTALRGRMPISSF